MSDFTTRLLDESTFAAFGRMVERNRIWGGCWCMGFHKPKGGEHELTREQKEARVKTGRTHAALVFDGDEAIGWCQYGRTEELPGIKHRRQYEAELDLLPDWRITCFVVDKQYRRRGVADLALGAALEEIARQGGGLVESYPEDTTDRKISSSFLYNATTLLFERHGFVKARRLGKDNWVVRKQVKASAEISQLS